MKVNIKFLLISLFSLFLLNSCDIFSTRTPEKPNSNRSSYQPPTSAQIVISNLIGSLKDKNIENYISCFADTSNGNNVQFGFIPSSDAESRFSNLFKNWSIDEEERYFRSMISNLKSDQNPNLILKNNGFDLLLSDSAVYHADYELYIPHNLNSIPENFSGTLFFTIIPNTNQLWSISSWVDISRNDTLAESWSILKAHFFN